MNDSIKKYNSKLKQIILGLGLMLTSLTIGVALLIGTQITADLIILRSFPGLMGLLGYYSLQSLEEEFSQKKGDDK